MKQIEAKQQITFSAITISVTDPFKLINHYSLSKTVTELQRSMHKYGIHEVFTVVKLFDVDGPDAGRLEDDNNGNIIRVTVDDVVQSSRWYQGFSDDAVCFDEDMEWSLAYFEKNAEPALYSRVYGDMLQFNKEAHGGPLFFKLLCKETSTTKESNRRAMITIIKTYKIKISCK